MLTYVYTHNRIIMHPVAWLAVSLQLEDITVVHAYNYSYIFNHAYAHHLHVSIKILIKLYAHTVLVKL